MHIYIILNKIFFMKNGILKTLLYMTMQYLLGNLHASTEILTGVLGGRHREGIK